MQQEARYTPVDTVQHRRKSSSGMPEHNARSNCFYIPNFNTLCIYCNKLLLFVILCGRDFASHDFAAVSKRQNHIILCAAHTSEFTLVDI